MNKSNPDIMQIYDVSEDRIFYKIIPGFFFDSKRIVRTDRISNWREWTIICEGMPDVVIINQKKYKLVENHE